MKAFGGLLVIGLVALWGCATGGDKQCEVVGVGTGVCCDLLGSDGQSRRGACINGVCTDGVESDPFNVACGSGGGSRRDQGGGLILDASAAGGMGGGAGGVGGGAGGVGGGIGGAGGEGGEGGGVGGAGGVGGGAGGAGGGMGGAGGGGDLCAGVVCDPGERCNPMTGNCQERPAGGCDADGDCTVGMCLTEADSEGAIPGGFCRVECSDDGDCDGARCLPSGETNLCFQVCGPARACRDGWACLPTTGEDGEPDGGSICLPDCRVPAVGCQPGFACNDGTGACEVAPPECRYPCQGGEECRDGRCIRANGTCATDYHCELNQQCRNGQCIVAEFQDCLNVNQCSPPDQTCFLFNGGLDGGLCLFSCANDDQCPLDRSCFVNDRVCYWRTCGPSEENGTVFGSCNTGGQNQWQGTCLPVQVPEPGQPQIGLCLEAGNVPEGGACDSQVEGRGAADRALQCGPGMLCFDDPDDALNPARDFAGRGACRQLCDPRQDRCDTPGRACIDFSTLDDAATPANETRYLGLCLQTDCTVARNDCAGGQVCRPYSLVAREGQCAAAGQVALGQACTTSNDCADSAFCANAGAGPVCLQICDPAAPECAGGTECRNEPGWGFGVCL